MYEKWHKDFTKAKVKVKVSILGVDALLSLPLDRENTKSLMTKN